MHTHTNKQTNTQHAGGVDHDLFPLLPDTPTSPRPPNIPSPRVAPTTLTTLQHATPGHDVDHDVDHEVHAQQAGVPAACLLWAVKAPSHVLTAHMRFDFGNAALPLQPGVPVDVQGDGDGRGGQVLHVQLMHAKIASTLLVSCCCWWWWWWWWWVVSVGGVHVGVHACATLCFHTHFVLHKTLLPTPPHTHTYSYTHLFITYHIHPQHILDTSSTHTFHPTHLIPTPHTPTPPHPQESCKHGTLYHPATLLHVGLTTPSLRSSLRVMQLLELILHLVLLRLTQQQQGVVQQGQTHLFGSGGCAQGSDGGVGVGVVGGLGTRAETGSVKSVLSMSVDGVSERSLNLTAVYGDGEEVCGDGGVWEWGGGCGVWCVCVVVGVTCDYTRYSNRTSSIGTMCSRI